MRAAGNGPVELTEKQKQRLFLEQLASSVEGPPKKGNAEMWFYLLMVALLVGAFLYTVWTLNRSGPASGVL